MEDPKKIQIQGGVVFGKLDPEGLGPKREYHHAKHNNGTKEK
jgi:hypothetical protein